MKDSRGVEIKKGEPLSIYRHGSMMDFSERLKMDYKIIEENVRNMATWIAEQDEKYLLEVFSRLPEEAKKKLMEVLG